WTGGAKTSRGDTTWLVRSVHLQDPRLTLIGAIPTNGVVDPIRRAATQNVLAVIVVAALAMVVASTFASRVSTVLPRFARGADAVAHGQLETRLEEHGPDEFASVARSFNAMAASLDHTLQRRALRQTLAASGEFAARLAHEVRNPLTSMRI